MKASMSIQILPNRQEERETVRIVDEVIAYIASTGLSYYVGPTETSVEGEDLHQLVEVLERCMYVAAEAGSAKVSGYVKLNYKPEGSVLTIEEKVGKYHR